jgi:hypothetical protein
MAKIIVSFILFCYLLSNSTGMKFSFKVEPKKTRCIGEHLIKHSSAKFNINSDQTQVRVRIIDHNGNIVYNKENKQTQKINYNPHDSGIHQICIDNFSKIIANTSFEYLYGVAAKDYSSLVTQDKIKPFELNVLRIYDSINIMHQEFKTLMTSESNYYISHTENISSSMIFFTIVVLGAISIVNITEFIYLKSYFKKRKII